MKCRAVCDEMNSKERSARAEFYLILRGAHHLDHHLQSQRDC